MQNLPRDVLFRCNEEAYALYRNQTEAWHQEHYGHHALILEGKRLIVYETEEEAYAARPDPSTPYVCFPVGADTQRAADEFQVTEPFELHTEGWIFTLAHLVDRGALHVTSQSFPAQSLPQVTQETQRAVRHTVPTDPPLRYMWRFWGYEHVMVYFYKEPRYKNVIRDYHKLLGLSLLTRETMCWYSDQLRGQTELSHYRMEQRIKYLDTRSQQPKKPWLARRPRPKKDSPN